MAKSGLSFGAALQNLIENPPITSGYLCGVEVLMNSLSDADREVFKVALATKSISTPALLRFLKDHGKEIGHNAVYKHRRGDCRCTKG